MSIIRYHNVFSGIASINTIKFSSYTNDLQNKMRRDVGRIKKSDKIIMKSDKTGKPFYIEAESYYKDITAEVSKFYEK